MLLSAILPVFSRVNVPSIFWIDPEDGGSKYL
jgi:hypothetical protein